METEGDELSRTMASVYARTPQRFLIEPDEVRQRVRDRRRKARVVAGGLAVAGVAAVSVASLQSGDDGSVSPAASESAVVVQGAGRNIEQSVSSSAHDWVASADIVVKVEVTGERRGSATATGDGTAGQFVERTVQLEVQQVLWASTPAAGLEVDNAIEVSAPGWVQRADGSTVRLATSGAPRLEVGRTYVVALTNSGCGATDPQRWATVGGGAVVPVDGDRLGFGESEGRSVAGDVDQTRPDSLEREVLGLSVSTLPPLLSEAAAQRSGGAAATNC